MRNKRFMIGSSLAATLLLLSCSTGNHYSKTGFGGSWGDGKVAKTTVKTAPQNVETVTTVESPSTTSLQVPESLESHATVKTSGKSISHVSANPDLTSAVAQKTATAKLSPGQKILSKAISRHLSKNHKPADDSKLLYIIIAILLPWLGVLLYEGELTSNFWITLLLWFLFYVPGLIYALLVILDMI